MVPSAPFDRGTEHMERTDVDSQRSAKLAELMRVAGELEAKSPEAFDLLLGLAAKMAETGDLHNPQERT